jgi:pimeloyl-ACP methyl ester carboxylesterase
VVGWASPPGGRPRPAWIDDEALDEYRTAFADPEAWASAIAYYRYALPFHIVGHAPDGRERFAALPEREVGEMWRGGLEQDPRYASYMDYGPDDRHKRYPHPVLWLYGRYISGSIEQGSASLPAGNPFFDQFARYFGDLRARAVSAGHFLGEEEPAYVNQCLLAFLRGDL